MVRYEVGSPRLSLALPDDFSLILYLGCRIPFKESNSMSLDSNQWPDPKWDFPVSPWLSSALSGNFSSILYLEYKIPLEEANPMSLDLSQWLDPKLDLSVSPWLSSALLGSPRLFLFNSVFGI